MTIEQTYRADKKRDREWVRFVKSEKKRFAVEAFRRIDR